MLLADRGHVNPLLILNTLIGGMMAANMVAGMGPGGAGPGGVGGFGGLAGLGFGELGGLGLGGPGPSGPGGNSRFRDWENAGRFSTRMLHSDADRRQWIEIKQFGNERGVAGEIVSRYKRLG